MTEFDLFRLNCFLNDTQANDFKRIIISLVCEHIFDNKNIEVRIDDCYKHIINYHKIEVEKDYFVAIVSNYNSFDQIPSQSDVLIKLTSKRFGEINDRLKEHSIDVYISKFIKSHNLSDKLLDPIKSLLYQAVFENISTFSTENLSSIISKQIKENYTNEEIEAFNDFLEDKDFEKNTAVYNVFLKATEFAIITSGKGIKEFSKDIFKGKTYCLDTNILFRILGIGGTERQNSLVNLIKYCAHQGIVFEYTPQTLQELKSKLAGSVKYLKSAELKFDIKTLGELFETDPQLFNEDFILHYSKLRANLTVNSPDQYELKLLSDFRTLEGELGFSLSKGDVKIEDKEKLKLSEELFKSRKSLPHASRYTKTAANIDAFNILYVRKIRGDNNYNYADVKSFYLSTDRTLNNILSKDIGVKIPETILPSQLFILHNPYTSNGEQVDYELFLQFVKRRTTEFHLKGGEVLTYINIIRKQTSSKTEMRNILKVYADKRYEVSNNHNIEERKVRPLQEIIDTVIDKKLEQGKLDSQVLLTIKDNANSQIPKIVLVTKWIVRVLDILITIILIPLTLVIARKLTQDIKIIIAVTLFVELTKYLITSRTRLWNYSWKILLKFRLKYSSYYLTTKDDNYITKGFEDYNKLDGDIWKRK